MINFSLFQGNRIIYTQRSHKNSRVTEQNPYRASQIKYNHTGRSWNGPGKKRAWGWLIYIVLDKTPSLEGATARLDLVKVLMNMNATSQLGMGRILLAYSSGSPVLAANRAGNRPPVKPERHVPKEPRMQMHQKWHKRGRCRRWQEGNR